MDLIGGNLGVNVIGKVKHPSRDPLEDQGEQGQSWCLQRCADKTGAPETQ
jgi:hypothetical protein